MTIQNSFSPSALSTLGKRVERLLYFGALLVLACFAEIYLVTIAVSARTIDSVQLAVLISKIEARTEKLQSLFSKQKRGAKPLELSSREDAISKTREQLGLPPKRGVDNDVAGETYASALIAIAREVSVETLARQAVVDAQIDTNVSPEAMISTLRARLKEISNRPVNVWGIESPTVIAFQYGPAKYQVPTAFVANAGLAVLTLLFMGWLVALYMTRQRELFNIRNLSDYKLAFPHVVNVLPLVLESFEDAHGSRFRRIRTRTRMRDLNRILCALFRSTILMMFVMPMLATVAYSFFYLLGDRAGEIWPLQVAAILLVLFLATQSILLLAQEWFMLGKKEFYV